MRSLALITIMPGSTGIRSLARGGLVGGVFLLPLICIRLGWITAASASHKQGRAPAAVQALFDDARKVLEQLGATVVDVDIPEWAELETWAAGPRSKRVALAGTILIVRQGIMREDFKAELAIWLDGLKTCVRCPSRRQLTDFFSNPNNIHCLEDVMAFNAAHKDFEMPPGYECQSTFDEALLVPRREDDKDYDATLDSYVTHAREILQREMRGHSLDAFILSNPCSSAFSKAHWPACVVPMGFLPQDTETVVLKNGATGEPYPIECVAPVRALRCAQAGSRTWTEYPGRPCGLTFVAEAFSESKLLSFGECLQSTACCLTCAKLMRLSKPRCTASAAKLSLSTLPPHSCRTLSSEHPHDSDL
jgi:Asp-tRNA(Asn)/Glu-tRNA(Gln) amidotransferase A subunit family amidase